MRSGFLVPGAIGPVALGGSGELADPVPVAGAELLTNGDFSAWSGDNPTGWTLSGAESGTVYVSEAAGAARIVSDGSNFGIYQSVLSNHTWYRVQLDIVSITGSIQIVQVGTVQFALWSNPGSAMVTARTAGVATGLGIYRGSATDATVDNASCKLLSLASLLSTRTYASADCDLSAAVTRTSGTQAGLCARLDSASSPANFIIAYLDGAGNVKVDKCVGGTYTNVISGAITYGSTKRLRLVCSGNSVSAYYDGVQVGSTVTVSDAGIVSNTRHGKFSTYASNTFSGYVAA